MSIKIQPFDTLFFRSGRPFSAGTDTWTEIAFPPTPSTFYGALRSFLIFNYGTLKEFKSGTHGLKGFIGYINNGKVKYGSLTLKSIYLFKDNLIYFFSPKDLVKKKKEEKDVLYLLQLKNKSNFFVSNYPIQNILVWQGNEQVDEPEGWLDINTFNEYLTNKKAEFRYTKQEDLFEHESKIGIARSRETFTTKEGHLYRIPFMRLDKETAFLLEIDGIDQDKIAKNGIFQLGGEGKAVKFEVLHKDPLKDIKDLEFNFENGYFKIYLATPAVFKNGWFPGWIDKNSLEGNYNGIKVKLVACVLGKPVSIGGWDLANQKPKPMRKTVPAGSVYYFKILNSSDAREIKEAFHYKNISDDFEDIEYSKEGFGLAILGEVKL